MERRSGRHCEPCLDMLWGPGGWQDLYKVEGYSPEIMDDAYK